MPSGGRGLLLCGWIWAQQTLINLPSVEVTPRKRFFILHETQLRFWRPAPYWVTSHFFVYGLSRDIEVGITFYDFGFPAQHYSTIATGYKFSRLLFTRSSLGKLEFRWTLGQMVTTSVTAKGVGVWTYSMLSARLPLLRTRLSAGGSAGPRPLFGEPEERLGFLNLSTIDFVASLEQPLTKDWQFVVEWFSGNRHEFAYVVVGFIFQKGDFTSVIAYKIANNPALWDTNGFVLEAGTFL
ncbi:MAG: hypothetical protein NZ958_01315 [Bacteroidia bacterium]|nr:hypothetical protein [Bacteroidia bacterium]MDW8089303.1 hypothetical protein [Bacteroidia bacterium]